ncbi:hypothetical protein HGA91_03515 [candidate division WWE3 bacterium]|nr:hypothetical protein [candidate division WWE3 bacterium]
MTNKPKIRSKLYRKIPWTLIYFTIVIFFAGELFWRTVKTNRVTTDAVASISTTLQDTFRSLMADSLIMAKDQTVLTLLDTTSDAKIKDTATYLQQTVHPHDFYDNVTIIDSTGKQILKLDHVGDELTMVPTEQLVDVHQEFYFQDNKRVNAPAFMVFPLTLKRSGDDFIQPYQPIIRVTHRILSEDGSFKGLVLYDCNANFLLEWGEQYDKKLPYAQYYLATSTGSWIVGPAEQDFGGGILPDRAERIVQKKYPYSWKKIGQDSRSPINSLEGMFYYKKLFPITELDTISSDFNDYSNNPDKGLSYFERGFSTPDFYWIVIGHVPTNLIWPAVYNITGWKFFYAFLVVFVIQIAFWIPYQMSKPSIREIGK